MGRLDQLDVNKNYNNVDSNWDNGLTTIVSDFSKKEDKILIVDADSIIHASVHPRREEMRDPYTEDEVETIIIPKIKERLFSLKEEVSKGFNILEMYCFVGGKGSYRKNIYKDYKANRKEKLEILPKVYEICCTDKDINFKKADPLLEADDMLFILNKEYGNLAILSYIDKDLNQCGSSIVYSYGKNIWYTVSEEEARKSLICQLFSGDASDNVPGLRGIGPKKAEKFYEECTNNFSVMRKLLIEYGKQYENTKEQVKLTYKLLSLGKIYEK